MVSLPNRIEDVDLSRRSRLIVYYLLGITVLVTFYSVLYNSGMRVFEGEIQSMFHSFQTVVETMTTTGYGADSPWETPVMNSFIVFMQLSGIGIGFFTLRVIVIPLFTGAEVDLDSRLARKRDHVIICEYRRDSAVLLDELRELDVDYVLISSDEANAKALSDDGYAAIHGSPQDATAFERASIETARTVITDAGDASVHTILTIRSLRPDVEVISLTDDSDMREVLLETGADTVLSPHGVLGHRLAEKAVAAFDEDLTDTIDLGGDLEVAELPILPGSDLVGKAFRESAIRERTGANVIGAWIDGELQLPPDPDAVIRENTVLLVSGGHDALEELSDFSRTPGETGKHDRIVIAGQGEVGQAATAVLEEAGIEVTTIDLRAGSGADIVGDAGSREVLREAGVGTADAIIVGLPDDSTALLTTVLARSMNPDIEVLTRVSDPNATQKALLAGADYVLSVPRISARMVAKELQGQDVLAPASQVRFIRVPATQFAGKTMAGLDIARRTECRVIAIETESGLSGTIDPHRELSGEEVLTIVGSDESIQQFLKQYEVTPATDSR